ncbi:hypothetical protein JKP88DRAFT_351739 [Tribonema minus]|uniref:Uncharacterized protein n=1 Tax=Tribonema minus TaxID=303371 RepID=A0A836C7H7_9STRA|nr:hypothetical protein JKP88DRAFT_351739 [Tribonema minus]
MVAAAAVAAAAVAAAAVAAAAVAAAAAAAAGAPLWFRALTHCTAVPAARSRPHTRQHSAHLAGRPVASAGARAPLPPMLLSAEASSKGLPRAAALA